MSRDQQPVNWEPRSFLNVFFPKRTKMSPAMSRQVMAEMILSRQLTEMALARFEWRGLPDSASSLWIEQQLLAHGQVLVGKHPGNGAILALQTVPVGNPNYQNEYAVFNGIGTNFKSTKFLTKNNIRKVGGDVIVDPPNAVVIYNNASRTGDVMLINYYAQRIAELDTTVDINSMNARRNKVVIADDDTELGMANILNEIASGEPVLRVRRPLEGSVTTLDLSVHPESIDRLHIFRGRLFNEAMMALGIDNTNQDKKERMVTDEIGGNDDQVARIRSAALNQRRKAAQQLSVILERPISVDYSVTDDPSHDPMPDVENATNVHA